MDFDKRIVEELKEAMKAKDQIKMDTLRAMKSAIKYKMVEKTNTPLTEEESISVFQTLIKQRKESVEQFEKGGMADRVEKEKREIAIIQAFLPTPLTADEVKALVAETIQALGAKGAQDMGKVMKELKPKVLGKADGKVVSDLVRQLLTA